MVTEPDLKVKVSVQSAISPLSSWWTILKEMAFHTKGEGASSTKGVYMAVGFTMCFCLLIMTAVFCRVYVKHKTADGTFATALGAMTIAVVGFVSNSQNLKTKTGASNAEQASADDKH